MIENNLLKIKIIQFEKEYLQKKGIKNPDTKTVLLMRRAVSSRLKKDIKLLSHKHNKIVNKIKNRKKDSSFLQQQYF